MPRKPPTGEQLLAHALKNGAEVVGEAPAKPKKAKTPQVGEFIGRLTGPNGPASRGWLWLETTDGLLYRWRTATDATPWGPYEEITLWKEAPDVPTR